MSFHFGWRYYARLFFNPISCHIKINQFPVVRIKPFNHIYLNSFLSWPCMSIDCCGLSPRSWKCYSFLLWHSLWINMFVGKYVVLKLVDLVLCANRYLLHTENMRVFLILPSLWLFWWLHLCSNTADIWRGAVGFDRLQREESDLIQTSHSHTAQPQTQTDTLGTLKHWYGK